MKAPKKNHCSFCAKSDQQVAVLIQAPDDCLICEECVEVCAHIISDKRGIELSHREAAMEAIFGVRSFRTMVAADIGLEG